MQFSSFRKNPSSPLLLGHTEPDVIKVGSTFYMYYRNDGTSKPSISVASSSDGLQWQERGTVLTASSSGFDSAEVIAPSVLYDNGVYYLYYESDDASQIGQRRVGVATSTSPIGPFTKNGVVLDYSGGWEGTIVGTPAIAKSSINNKYYLFYHGYSSGSDRIGVAYSTSPTGPFTKEPNNPILDIGPSGSWDDNKVAPSSAYFDGASNTMIVFYEGFDGVQVPIVHWRIGIADGSINPLDGRIKSLVRRTGANPIIDLGVSGSWDDATVQLPSAIKMGTEMWVYYSGNDGSAFRLGRAIANIL
jgi:beta-xylosidase